MRIGSDEHKQLFCRVFLETHNPYRPEEIAWPDLDEETRARLAGLPVWDEAARTEHATAVKVQTLGEVEPDPVLAEAIALQGYEEARHSQVIRLLVKTYGIPIEDSGEAARPKNPVWAFVRTGYGECLDSFFAFGLFDIGKRSNFFPPGLIDVFEPIMQEEARHILFLVNWVAYLRARTPLAARPLFDARRAWCIAAQAVGRARGAMAMGRGEKSKAGFTIKSHESFGHFSPRSFFGLCLAENERRLAPYDQRLLRPTLVPSLVRLALKVMPGRPPRVAADRPADPL